MKVAVGYESVFGDTEALAIELARGLAQTGAQVVVTEVGEAAPTDFVGCRLLVVAAPSHEAMMGPLVQGEGAHAFAWARDLAAVVRVGSDHV